MQTRAFAVVATDNLKHAVIINVNSGEGVPSVECVVDEIAMPRIGSQIAGGFIPDEIVPVPRLNR